MEQFRKGALIRCLFDACYGLNKKVTTKALENGRKSGIYEIKNLRRCVIDKVYNVPSRVQKDIRKIMKKAEKKKLEIPKISTPTLKKDSPKCKIIGGSHFKTFDGKRFTSHHLGDWTVVESKEFSVHRRARKVHHASVTKRIALNLHGDKVETKMANKFILNHDTRVHLKIGQRFRLPNGSVVKRLSKHKVKYYTRYGSVLARFVRYRKNRYINLIVKVPKEAKISGECSGSKNVAHGIFKNELIIKATEHFHH